MEGSLAHKLSGNRTEDVRLKEIAPFSQWLLKNNVKRGLHEAGFRLPTVIQAMAIPVGKTGMDLLIQSKAGTGKTLIFCTVLLETCSEAPGLNSLIIAPTREIAIQIEMVLHEISKYCKGFKVVRAIGGTQVSEDRKSLQTAKTIVGTPGRLVHLIESDILPTSNIRLVVLDEADQLYSSSHRKNIETILNAIPSSRQVLACSATFGGNLDEELAKVMQNPLFISTKDKSTVLLGIKQFVYELPEEKTSILEMEAKVKALGEIFGRISFKSCIIFAGSQSRAETYANYLNKDGWACHLISGAQSQTKRTEVFRKFQNSEARILVSTDLMARGIDSENVNLVVNMEFPRDVVTYLHRIGRAGRFGSYGIAISLMSSENDNIALKKIVSEIGLSIFKFPKLNADNKEDENFWDPSNFKLNAEQFELIQSDQENVNFQPQKNNNENESVDESNSSIDTHTFHIDSKDSAVNMVPFSVENKENMLPIPAEDTPTSNRSSVQLSANTIDDASSIAADSILSAQKEIVPPPPPSPANISKPFKKDAHANCISADSDDIKRAKALQSDVFLDYWTVNENNDSSQQKNEEIKDANVILRTNSPDISEISNGKARKAFNDIFDDYVNFICREDEDKEEDIPSVVENSDAGLIAQIKETLASNVPIAAFQKIVDEAVAEPNEQLEDKSGEPATDSQTFLQDTLCATNGSYSADSEHSSEQKTESTTQGKKCFVHKITPKQSAVEVDIQNEEQLEEEPCNENKDTEDQEVANVFAYDEYKKSPLYDMWMEEYWRQVNFIKAYTEFVLDN